MAALAADAHRGRFAGQVLTARQLADEYGVTDTDGSRPDCWGLIAERGWGDHEPEVVGRTAEAFTARASLRPGRRWAGRRRGLPNRGVHSWHESVVWTPVAAP